MSFYILNMTSMAAESSRQAAMAAPQAKQDDSHRYKIMVCGWRKWVMSRQGCQVIDMALTNFRAGKTSCIKTVFQDVPIKDVSYFGTTQKIEKINYE